MNALVLYVGTQAITYIHSKSGTPSMSTITHSSHMDIFQNLAVDLDTEGMALTIVFLWRRRDAHPRTLLQLTLNSNLLPYIISVSYTHLTLPTKLEV